MNLLFDTFDFLINRPLLMLVLMAAPLFLLARMAKLYPSKRFLWIAALAPVLLSMAISPTITIFGQFSFMLVFLAVLLIDGLVLLVAALDALLTVRPRHFQCRRNLLRTSSQGKKYDVEVEVTNRGRWGCLVSVKDDCPQSFEVEPEHFTTWLGGISTKQFTYRYVCNQRGQAALEWVYLLVHSPLGLWRGNYQLPCPSVVNVYPDMQQIAEYDLLARTNRLSLMGLRRSRRIGQDNEFERLRDYTQDDNYKHIDWRSTARRRKLTVRDFQSDQSQRVIFMLDCGRMMTGTHDELSMLDHSINAMLMLSYVALRRGDSVGLITFSDRIHNFTPPKSSVSHINRLLQATFNQQPMHVESRYDDAFLYLRTHCRKRSLVVLMTNVIDDINALQVNQYMSVMTGQHLPLAVLLRDHDMFDPIEEYEAAMHAGEASPSAIYEAAAAANVLTWRHQVIHDLKRNGVLSLDVFPEQMTADLVNQYLEIKARHLL